MAIFSWIVLGLVGLLLLLSGIAWLMFILLDDRDWKRLGVRLFRYALAGVLFYINGVVWAHLVKTFL